MRIEVLHTAGTANKEQGDVLEHFIHDWMVRQNYDVVSNVRVNACEIDLLCTHQVSKKKIHVECKAYNDKNLSANDLHTFLGKVSYGGYEEGWFVTTGELGKDAKGFVEGWNKDSPVLSFFTPEVLIQSLIQTRMLVSPPDALVNNLISDSETSGEWVLVLCEMGRYWAVPILKQGMPIGWLLYTANNVPTLVSDEEILRRISSMKFSLAAKYRYYAHGSENQMATEESFPVIEVECGDGWTDYRPAKPEFFVGRKQSVNKVFALIRNVTKGGTNTRAFAIVGDSGIGKSSFIVKIRADANVGKNAQKVYVFAADMRAAGSESYVDRVLLKCLQNAQEKGFGCKGIISLTNADDPLNSASVRVFLEECRKRKQAIVLVLDQFEELYSKQKLMNVFISAKKLMLSAISAQANFVVGFAWKTDCAIPQEHPAYYMWQSLTAHRLEIKLQCFSGLDVSRSLALFESNLGRKLRPDLKRFIVEQSQGLPWLLKKLCVHLEDRLNSGVTQLEIENSAFDAASLFEQDLCGLTKDESSCVKLVALNMPMDWFDVVESSSDEVVNDLIRKQLLIRRGNKLSLYWDIFRDYVVNKSTPPVPFTYIPVATTPDKLVKFLMKFSGTQNNTLSSIAKDTGLQESTVRNLLIDLNRFGIVLKNGEFWSVENEIDMNDSLKCLRKLRSVFNRHQLVVTIRREGLTYLDQDIIIGVLKGLLPPGTYDANTFRVYSRKMMNWLARLGFGREGNGGLIIEDRGDVSPIPVSLNTKGSVFIADTSPLRAVDVFCLVMNSGARGVEDLMSGENKHAGGLLVRMKMIKLVQNSRYAVCCDVTSRQAAIERLFEMVSKEASVKMTIRTLEDNPNVTATEIGSIIADSVKRIWTPATKKRIGGALKIWASWILLSRRNGTMLPPPGRSSKRDSSCQQYFDFSS